MHKKWPCQILIGLSLMTVTLQPTLLSSHTFLTALTAQAATIYSTVSDHQKITYTIDHSKNTASVSSYFGPSGAQIIIPATINENENRYPVIEIGTSAFLNSGISSVVIGDNVTDINTSAFQTTTNAPNFYKSALKEVQFGINVQSIKTDAFAGNALTEVQFPSVLTRIGTRAFANNFLKQVNFEVNLQEICAKAFQSNTLESIYFSDEANTLIDSMAFSGSPIKDIHLGQGVTWVDDALNKISLLFTQLSDLPSSGIRTIYRRDDGTIFKSWISSIITIEDPVNEENDTEQGLINEKESTIHESKTEDDNLEAGGETSDDLESREVSAIADFEDSTKVFNEFSRIENECANFSGTDFDPITNKNDEKSPGIIFSRPIAQESNAQHFLINHSDILNHIKNRIPMTNVKLSPTFPKNKMLEVPIQEQVKRINSEIQEKPVRKKYNESFHSDDIVKPTPHKTIPSDHKLQDQVLKSLITNNVKKNKKKSKLNLESETRRINRSKSKKLYRDQKESRRAKGISPNQKVRARPKKIQKEVMSNEINKAKAQTEQSKIPRKKTFFNKIKAVLEILLATCFGIVLSRFLGWSQK